MKIAYLGPEGSYSQEAAQGYTKKKKSECMHVCSLLWIFGSDSKS